VNTDLLHKLQGFLGCGKTTFPNAFMQQSAFNNTLPINNIFSGERNRGFDRVVLEPIGLVGTTPIQHALMPDISLEKHHRSENISRIQVP